MILTNHMEKWSEPMRFSDAHGIPQWFHPHGCGPLQATQNFHEDNRLGFSAPLVENRGPMGTKKNQLVHHHFP